MLAWIVNSSIPSSALTEKLALVPWPQRVELREGTCRVPAGLALAAGNVSPRVAAMWCRMSRRWQKRAEWPARRKNEGGVISLSICVTTRCAEIPTLGDDESYRLCVEPQGVALSAATDFAALRGLATLEQLLATEGGEAWLPCVVIEDWPRFPWRGLMLDVCRHWQSLEAVLRQLEAMALAKLNVLHLHLTDDQGFRVESRTSPRLHEGGSDGRFYSQGELRTLVNEAAARGIRIVPEFDVPGHATSWLAGHPELASQPGNYAVERRWGVHDAALDPTNEAVYARLDAFFGEMALLFPDDFVHIGGDENNGAHWNANPRIREFMRGHALADHRALQAHFNRRVSELLARQGKKIVGWDEVLHPDLPRDAVVQSWRGPESLADAARRGYSGLLSSGYYLDHCQPAAWHYAHDPLPEENALGPVERARVLLGERLDQHPGGGQLADGRHRADGQGNGGFVDGHDREPSADSEDRKPGTELIGGDFTPVVIPFLALVAQEEVVDMLTQGLRDQLGSFQLGQSLTEVLRQALVTGGFALRFGQ